MAASEGSEDATEVFAGLRSGKIGAKLDFGHFDRAQNPDKTSLLLLVAYIFQRRLFHPMLKNPGTESKLKMFIDNTSYPKWTKSS
jgi:hypothetical protein